MKKETAPTIKELAQGMNSARELADKLGVSVDEAIRLAGAWAKRRPFNPGHLADGGGLRPQTPFGNHSKCKGCGILFIPLGAEEYHSLGCKIKYYNLAQKKRSQERREKKRADKLKNLGADK